VISGQCPKCGGTLFLEADIPEGLLLSKCLNCGLIAAYYWYERRTGELIPLPPELDEPVEAGETW
jgi:hypothetical protein